MDWKKTLNRLSLILFIIAGSMSYAYVYDVEPFTQEKRYEMDREIYHRTHDFTHGDFISFHEWVKEQENKEARFKEWVNSLAEKIGEEAALTFDPWYQARDYDPRAAAAKEDCMRGERDRD